MKLPWKLFLSVIFSSSLIFMISALEADATRGVRLQIRASEQPTAPIVEEVQLYGSSYALVIGINNYTQGWPRLSNAIRDAELVADELREKGFEVTLKIDLNSTDLKSTFEEFFVYKGEDPQARLFVWFAGHGHTQNGEGYLIPADAPLPGSGAIFRIKALSMRRFGEYVRLARAKHAFAVFDSCFSGTIFTTQRSAPPAAVTRATTLPVRQFLSSGDADQQVSDDGRFRKLFIRALRGEERADANGDGYLTGSELGLFLTDRVTNLTENRQTPRSGKLRDEDYDRGDFVFFLSSSGAVVEKPEQTGSQAILSVESNVTGARVLVDGHDVGSTNLSDTEILPGEHRIRVEKEGYEPYSKKVRFAKIKVAEPIPAQKTITNSIGMKFVPLAAGSFAMGSKLSPEEVARKYGGQAQWHEKEQPQHNVKISKPFYLQTTEVSQGQWKMVMGDNPSRFKDCGNDCPVENVSWDMAQQFISKLNHMEGTNKYRLPTEAEWEYACRAETTTPFFTGECISTDQANYSGSSPGKNCPQGDRSRETFKVGSFHPNAWDLYDMHGNVWEWSQDRYGNYPTRPLIDPRGPSEGKSRVVRGGSFSNGALDLRSAFRRDYRPSFHFHDLGFRVALDF